MRFLALLLIGFLIQTNPTADGPDRQLNPICRSAKSSSTWSEIQEAVRSGDGESLRGMLFPQGISVAASDTKISHRSMQQAIDAWNECLPEHLFRLAGAGEAPTVKIAEVKKIEVQDDLQGQIESETDDQGHIRASILVCAQNDGHPLSETQIGMVLTHEFGHLLGLDDAPDDVSHGTCIMGDFDPNCSATKPSAAEAQTVRDLRTAIRAALDKV